MIRVGAHVSAAGGPAQALARAEELGVDTIQIFGSSPRQWAVRPLSEEARADYFRMQERRKVDPVFLHAPYLVNLAASDQELWRRSINCLAGHLEIAEHLSAFGLVFHVGSSGEPKKNSLERVLTGMREVLSAVPGQTCLIVENSVRGGHKLGVNPVEIGHLIDQVGSSRVGFCFDTAHAFQAGFWHGQPGRMERYLADWEDKVGWEHLMLVHANDSASDFNSGLDRHANIGEGQIGQEGFSRLAEQNAFARVPWILEVPGFDGRGPDRRNVEILQECCR